MAGSQPAGSPRHPRELPPDMAGLEKLAGKYAFPPRREKLGEEVADSQELLLYGLKGMSAYLHHARRLGRTDAACDAFLVRALSALAKPGHAEGRTDLPRA